MRGSSNSKSKNGANERARPLGRGAGARRLRLKGYRLLARRFKSPPGEIDLIMRRGQVTAFIEVKVRPTPISRFEAVTPLSVAADRRGGAHLDGARSAGAHRASAALTSSRLALTTGRATSPMPSKPRE